jgi:hypothetical protein
MTASVTVSPRYDSAISFMRVRTIALTSGGDMSLPATETHASPFGASMILYGLRSVWRLTSSEEYFLPMRRFTA